MIDVIDAKWNRKRKSILPRLGCAAAFVGAVFVSTVGIDWYRSTSRGDPVKAVRDNASENWRMINYGGVEYLHIRGQECYYRIGRVDSDDIEKGDGKEKIYGRVYDGGWSSYRTNLFSISNLLNGGDPIWGGGYLVADAIIREKGPIIGLDSDPLPTDIHQTLRDQFIRLQVPFGTGIDSYLP